MEVSWKVVAGDIFIIILLVWVVFKQREKIGGLKAGHHEKEEPKKRAVSDGKAASKFVD